MRYNRSAVLDPSKFSDFANGGARHAATMRRVVVQQPSWIVRVAMLAFVLIVAIPFLVLFVVAVVVGGLLFAGLAAVNAVVGRIRGSLPKDDGRENVRVIRRD